MAYNRKVFSKDETNGETGVLHGSRVINYITKLEIDSDNSKYMRFLLSCPLTAFKRVEEIEFLYGVNGIFDVMGDPRLARILSSVLSNADSERRVDLRISGLCGRNGCSKRKNRPEPSNGLEATTSLLVLEIMRKTTNVSIFGEPLISDVAHIASQTKNMKRLTIGWRGILNISERPNSQWDLDAFVLADQMGGGGESEQCLGWSRLDLHELLSRVEHLCIDHTHVDIWSPTVAIGVLKVLCSSPETSSTGRATLFAQGRPQNSKELSNCIIPLEGVTEVTIMGPPRVRVYEHICMPNVKKVAFEDISLEGNSREENFSVHGGIYAKLLIKAFPNCNEFKINAPCDIIGPYWWSSWGGRGYLFETLKSMDSFERTTKGLKIVVDSNVTAFMEMIPPPCFNALRNPEDRNPLDDSYEKKKIYWDPPDYIDMQREIYYYLVGSDRVLGGCDIVLSNSQCCSMHPGVSVVCPSWGVCVNLNLVCTGCADLLPFIQVVTY